MPLTEELPIQAARSYVRFLQDITDALQDFREKGLTFFPPSVFMELATKAAEIVCGLWAEARATGADMKPAARESLLRLLPRTRAALDYLHATVGGMPEHLRSDRDFARLRQLASDIADLQAEAALGLPWDTSAVPKVSPEAARRGKEAARAGRMRDLEDAIRDLETRG
jgi:hypothetical protein